MPKGVQKKESKGKPKNKKMSKAMPKMSLSEHNKMMKASGRAY